MSAYRKLRLIAENGGTIATAEYAESDERGEATARARLQREKERWQSNAPHIVGDGLSIV